MYGAYSCYFLSSGCGAASVGFAVLFSMYTIRNTHSVCIALTPPPWSAPLLLPACKNYYGLHTIKRPFLSLVQRCRRMTLPRSSALRGGVGCCALESSRLNLFSVPSSLFVHALFNILQASCSLFYGANASTLSPSCAYVSAAADAVGSLSSCIPPRKTGDGAWRVVLCFHVSNFSF